MFVLPLALRIVAGIAAAYFGINVWGFYENEKIDRELRKLTQSNGELIGFVYLQPPTMYDAHAEVGILTVAESYLEISSERGGIVLNRSDIVALNRRYNIHSVLLLGGWIVLELKNGSEFKFESRKFPTMHMSKLRTDQLFLDLALWHGEPEKWRSMAKYEKSPA